MLRDRLDLGYVRKLHPDGAIRARIATRTSSPRTSRIGAVRLLPPQLVEMTSEQRRVTVQSLAVFLGSWLEAGCSPLGREESAYRQHPGGGLASLRGFDPDPSGLIEPIPVGGREILAALATAAMVTSTIRLGTLVASPSFRHPVPFARELLTLDHIAGGRLTVGVGAGAQGW